jgi:PTH1 family peptidyl-tRNA hydrolase
MHKQRKKRPAYPGGPFLLEWRMVKKYLCGLGNPGAKYARTRHNVGWWVLDELQRKLNLPESGEKHDALFKRGLVDGVQLTLIYPQTFMNDSGLCLAQWKQRAGMDPSTDLIVLFDDMDLAPGRVRLRPKGSGGSHNGMSDVVERLGTRDIPRLRLGVGRPEDPALWADYVLSSIPPDEKKLLESAVVKAAEACLAWLKNPDIPALMSRVNAA